MATKHENDIDNLVRISQMYYYENMSQAEIAKIFGISRPQISKLLLRARERGIVNIIVQSPQNSIEKMQQSFVDHFSLKNCFIIPSMLTSFESEKLLTKTASEIIERLVARSAVIGLGWGDLIYTICNNAIVQPQFSESSVVLPLVGSITAPNRGYNTNELVRAFSVSYSMTPYYLHAPAFPSSQLELDQFRQTVNHKQIYQYWNKMDVTIFRISNFPSVPDLATSSRFGDMLMQKKAVGAILSYYYDIDGNIIRGANDYCVAASLEQIKKTPSRLAIASTSTTAQSLLGLLNSGCATHLILAEETAKELIGMISLR